MDKPLIVHESFLEFSQNCGYYEFGLRANRCNHEKCLYCTQETCPRLKGAEVKGVTI